MFHLTETLSAYQARDPAARSKLEVFLLYPGVHATMYHQAAHFCYCHKMKFLAAAWSSTTAWASSSARRQRLGMTA